MLLCVVFVVRVAMAEYMSERELRREIRNLNKDVQEQRRKAALQREEMSTHSDRNTRSEHMQSDVYGERDLGDLSFEGSPSYQDQVRRELAQQTAAATAVDRSDLGNRSFEILTSQQDVIDLDHSYRTIDEFGFRDPEKLKVSSIIDDDDVQRTRIEEFSSLDRETRRLTNIMKNKESVHISGPLGDNTAELSQFLDRHQQAVDQTRSGDTRVKELAMTRQVVNQIQCDDGTPVKEKSLPRPHIYENSATSDIQRRKHVRSDKTTCDPMKEIGITHGDAEDVMPSVACSTHGHVSDLNASVDNVQMYPQTRAENLHTYTDVYDEDKEREVEARARLKHHRLLKEEEELRVRQKLVDEWKSKSLELKMINEESKQRNKQLEMERLDREAQTEKQERMEIQRQLMEKEELRLKMLQKEKRLQEAQKLKTKRKMLEERERRQRLKRDEEAEKHSQLLEDR